MRVYFGHNRIKAQVNISLEKYLGKPVTAQTFNHAKSEVREIYCRMLEEGAIDEMPDETMIANIVTLSIPDLGRFK